MTLLTFVLYANVALATILLLWLAAQLIVGWLFEPAEETYAVGFRFEPEPDPDADPEDDA